MKRLAIIPARGGSKRIPDKNIKDFCGKPIISYSIEAAANTTLFDQIHVSTDSKTIADIATEAGYSPNFLRPKEFSGDHAPMMEAIKFVIDEYESIGTSFDTVALIYATSPLIDFNDLKNACESFEASNKSKPLLAVTPFPSPIEHAFRMKDNMDLCPDSEVSLSKRTQDLPESFYDAGMFAIYSSDFIKNNKTSLNFNSFRGYVVPAYRVTDIDWPEDWVLAEKLYKALDG